MAWVAIDKDGSEWVYNGCKPHRCNNKFFPTPNRATATESVELPKGSIKKLIGRKLSWEDEAVEL